MSWTYKPSVSIGLLEIERQLPDRYTFPGDPPLDGDRLPRHLACGLPTYAGRGRQTPRSISTPHLLILHLGSTRCSLATPSSVTLVPLISSR